MTDSPGNPQTDRRAIVESFARTLSDLRQQAGQPSFRQMSQTSGCISHATLHEATRGKRLPTWETTEQFLIACHVNPADWRGEWSRVDRLVNRRPASPARPGPAKQPVSASVSAALPRKEVDTSWTAEDGDDRETAPMRVGTRAGHVVQRWGSTRSVLGTALAAVLLVAAGFTAANWTRSAPTSSAASAPAVSSTGTSLTSSTASPAPVAFARTTPASIGSVTCPRAGEPMVKYWGAAHRDDVSIEYRASKAKPLCATIAAGKKVEVGFTLTNRGSATVSGLRMHMTSSTGDCLKSEDRDRQLLPLRPNAPQSVILEFTAPQAGECSAEYEIRDRDGKPFLPAGATIPFAVVVA